MLILVKRTWLLVMCGLVQCNDITSVWAINKAYLGNSTYRPSVTGFRSCVPFGPDGIVGISMGAREPADGCEILQYLQIATIEAQPETGIL